MLRLGLVALSVLASALTLAGCGGGSSSSTASVAVTVTDHQGKPVAGAGVSVDGAGQALRTDAHGVAELELGRGTHRVEASAVGYLTTSRRVASTGHPESVRVSLPFAPPRGTFVTQDQSNQWYVLSVSSVSPFRASLRSYLWDCTSGSWGAGGRFDPQLGTNDAVVYAPDGKIHLTGPGQLAPAWLKDDGTLGPRTSVATQPAGACLKGAPAWQLPIGEIAPLASSPASLRLLQAALGKPIYWIGPRAGVTYELRRLAAGSTYVRYIPHGVAIGTSGYLIVGTYPVKFAAASLKQLGKGAKAKLVDIANGSAVYLDNFPKTAYVAYAGSDYEIELFDPKPGGARKLAAAGAVRPVGS
jgi:carboxypeptidase family protein